MKHGNIWTSELLNGFASAWKSLPESFHDLLQMPCHLLSLHGKGVSDILKYILTYLFLYHYITYLEEGLKDGY